LLSTGPFVLPKKDRGKPAGYPEYQRSGKEILCRLIKVKLPDGTDEILCTSLLDRQEYASEEFDELYPYRWGEEDAYKLLKARVEVENFSGKTALSVKQDENRTHGQQINRTNALSMTRDILVGVFLKQQFGKAIKAFDDIVAKTREIIRPGRSVKRNKKTKKLYSMNYRRL
jgi:hypothetical protein